MPVKKKSKRQPKVIAAFSTYIDPLDCDSTVSYKIVDYPLRVRANVQLADCNRKIDWYFGNDKRALQKADNAIKALTEFRDQLKAAQEARRKRTRKPKAVAKP